MVDITADEVWKAVAAENFMVVGMVSARGGARTAGVMHQVHDGRVWFTTNERLWKARHIAAEPNVSVTVPIAKRIPLLPWIRIPAATVTFCGVAETIPAADLHPEVAHALLHGLDVTDGGELGALIAIGIRPVGDFVTYGVGVSAMGMRDTEAAAGRVAVDAPATAQATAPAVAARVGG
ncbi:pyridoxamine 5'-phosphate oxidase family protein [Agromyces sp. MMS24-JH15]|uniref:pyridoxamine 5'-phosphate oxidase family protein n=1 Tax=Agromyces sp. MMS24-JH15 TaxID=3243765 RepID=UPI003748972F